MFSAAFFEMMEARRYAIFESYERFDTKTGHTGCEVDVVDGSGYVASSVPAKAKLR